MNIYRMQISALSRINFCLYELKKTPPLETVSNFWGENIGENISKYNEFTPTQQKIYKYSQFIFLKRESTTEARIMLIINYLHALLGKGKYDRISIFKSHKEHTKVKKFYQDNSNIIKNIQTVRNKIYSHMDPFWEDNTMLISFDDIDICVNFLNDLFDYRFEALTKYDI